MIKAAAVVVLFFILNVLANPEGHCKPVDPKVVCRRGPRGSRGKTGFRGPAGFSGAQGQPGIDGKNVTFSMSSSYINVYTDQNPPYAISINGTIPVNTIQALSSTSDFTFDPVTSEITVKEAGSYYITFNVAAYRSRDISLDASIGLALDGVFLPNCQYWSENTYYYVIGQCLVTIGANQKLTLVNLTGSPITLWNTDDINSTLISVRASLVAYKVSGPQV